MDTTTEERSIIIAEDNDMFRSGRTSNFTITMGVWYHCDVAAVVQKVREFSEFSEDNDPYGEHDFGSFEDSGHKLFWKIDYYDGERQGYCDPLANECERVLTVMLAEEY